MQEKTVIETWDINNLKFAFMQSCMKKRQHAL